MVSVSTRAIRETQGRGLMTSYCIRADCREILSFNTLGTDRLLAELVESSDTESDCGYRHTSAV